MEFSHLLSLFLLVALKKTLAFASVYVTVGLDLESEVRESVMVAPEKSPSNTNSMQRVKVYHLNEDGRWDDRGTGHVNIDYVERSEELSLCVIDEENNEMLLVHPINQEDIYRKQEDTIISWRDPERSTELALSFQETAGCSYVWDQICTMQRNLHFSSLNSKTATHFTA